MQNKDMETSVFAENLQNAEQLKLSGNDAFKIKDYRKAIGCYHRALLYLKSISMKKGIFSDLLSQTSTSRVPDEIMEKAAALTSDCYNNLAACLLASENPKNEKVIEYCKMSLEINPDNLKAVFRMGTALANLGRYEEAKEVLTSHKCYGTEKKFVQLLLQVEQKIKEADEECKQVFQRMFQPKLTTKPDHSTAEQVKEQHFQEDQVKVHEVHCHERAEEVKAHLKQPVGGAKTLGEHVEKTACDTDNESSVLSECRRTESESVGKTGSKKETL